MWFVFVQSVILISRSFPIYYVENHGVLIFLGESTPTGEFSEIIKEWKKVKFVDLRYHGPEFLEKPIKDSLMDCGIYSGGYIPLFVRIFKDQNDELYAVYIWYNGKSWDNFTNLVEKENLVEVVIEGVTNLVGCFEKPRKAFVVKVAHDGMVTEATDNTAKPLHLEYLKKDVYDVVLNDESTTMTFGFHMIDDTSFFVGRDNLKVATLKHFKNVDRVYYTKKGWIFCKNGLISFSNGKLLNFNICPLWIHEGCFIFRNKILCNGKERLLPSSAVGFYNGIILLADGTVGDVEGTWKMKVGCPVLEWDFLENRLYLLDICGYLKILDLKKKDVNTLGRFPGAYGFDFKNGEVVVIPDEAVGKNFCLQNGKVMIGENYIRTHRDFCLNLTEEGLILKSGNVIKNFSGWDIQDGFLIIYGKGEVWVKRLKR